MEGIENNVFYIGIMEGFGCILMALSGIAYFSIHIFGSSIDSTLQVGRGFTLKLSMKCRLVSKVILCLPSLFSFLVLRYFDKHRMFALV
jgi:hypothetical protein